MDLYTTGEVAKVFGMAESNILHLLKSGKLKNHSREVSTGKYLFDPQEIRRYFKLVISELAIIIMFTNIKGGTGKTFSVYMYALGLLHLGFKVLEILCFSPPELT